MIQVFPSDLDAATLATLARLQGIVDDEPDYAGQVKKARSEWDNKRGSIPKRQAFDVVTRELIKMCSGPQRCCYCDDAPADEIEHIAPKSRYPECTFVWDNYLYACGSCNRPKDNLFSVFTPNTDDYSEVTPNTKAYEPVLINPRIEDPLDFLKLDLVNNFIFVPLGEKSSRKYKRAEYTIQVLGLNDREYLPDARAGAFQEYLALLEKYAQSPAPHLYHAILRKNHVTVWREMQRQHLDHDDLKPLFEKVPEALNWLTMEQKL
jgi:uncharacterized protein (TIGR02646 family)